jgi:hypothetical protein
MGAELIEVSRAESRLSLQMRGLWGVWRTQPFIETSNSIMLRPI